MKKKNRIPVKEPDDFDILSAVWILSCNDENEIITFEGIKYRLNLPENYNIKALICSRGELFRRGVPSFRLEEWKKEMLSGLHIPSWILEIEDSSSRKQAITSITRDDVFRNQFRAERNANRSPIEIIDWGLQHIDRLRKASLEAHEQSVKGWQMWLVFLIGVINLITTIIISLVK